MLGAGNKKIAHDQVEVFLAREILYFPFHSSDWYRLTATGSDEISPFSS